MLQELKDQGLLEESVRLLEAVRIPAPRAWWGRSGRSVPAWHRLCSGRPEEVELNHPFSRLLSRLEDPLLFRRSIAITFPNPQLQPLPEKGLEP